MADNLIIVGSGGCMREFLWQLDKKDWNIVGYVDKNKNRNITKLPYLGDDDYLLNYKEKINIGVCIGDSMLRYNIVIKLIQNRVLEFPVLIGQGVKVASSANISEGTLIGMGCIIGPDVTIGKFTFINTNTLVSHDCTIGDYVSISPSVSLAGNIYIGNLTEIGIGVKAIQGTSIGSECIIGAGAVVVNDISEGSKAVGIPAKKIK